MGEEIFEGGGGRDGGACDRKDITISMWPFLQKGHCFSTEQKLATVL